MYVDERIINARYFREMLALEILEKFEVGDYYKKGLTGAQIDRTLGISNKLKLKPGKQIDTAILMAIGGFQSLDGTYHQGQIPPEEYKQIAINNQIHKGRTGSQRSELGTNANNARLIDKGIPCWTDDEKYLIWKFMYNGPKDGRGRVLRKELTQILNDEFHQGLNMRDSTHVRNIMTQYTNLRNSYLEIKK